VDLYGSMPEMAALLAISRHSGIPLIEDAAEAIGSRFAGVVAGAFGDASVFSFHGSKTLTTGEGGMVVTDREDLYARMCVLRDHGRLPGDTTFFNAEVAQKYKMSSLQAAFGLAQVERVEELIARKRQQFAWYANRLGDLSSQVVLNPMPQNSDVVPWMVTAVFAPGTGLTKPAVGTYLGARGLDTRPFFHPLSSLPAYADFPGVEAARSANVVSYDLSSRGINLPSALRLDEADVDVVASAIRELLGSI
jgi:perosamine synthetase